ncbi:MAG: ester cyclase [Steroidobacteraceae bacterium]
MNIVRNMTGILMTVALLGACAQQAKEDPAVTSMRAAADSQTQMLAAVNSWVAAWDSGNTDGLDAIAAASFARRAPDRNADSLDELKALIADVHKIYPDFRITNDATAAGPDGAFVHWTVTGTDSGSEAATGKPVNLTGISRYQFVEGKIASELVIFDSGELLKQLGSSAIPHVIPDQAGLTDRD